MEHHPPTLAISGLRAGSPGPQGLVPCRGRVDSPSPGGTIVGLVGESGCGKSVTALSVLGGLPPNGQVAGGTIDFGGQDLLTLPPDALRCLRGGPDRHDLPGSHDPQPRLPCGGRWRRSSASTGGWGRPPRPGRWTSSTRWASPTRRPGTGPTPGSSPGLRQRVMIAMAMACEPEPHRRRAHHRLRRHHPSPDPPAHGGPAPGPRHSHPPHHPQHGGWWPSSGTAHVMYAGQIVEAAETFDLFRTPPAPIHAGLLRAIPPEGGPRSGHHSRDRAPGRSPPRLPLLPPV